MSSHSHQWNPIDGECGKYACICGAVGRRTKEGIVAYKSPQSIQTEASVRPIGGAELSKGGYRLGDRSKSS